MLSVDKSVHSHLHIHINTLTHTLTHSHTRPFELSVRLAVPLRMLMNMPRKVHSQAICVHRTCIFSIQIIQPRRASVLHSENTGQEEMLTEALL